jgi:hypothetical protein
MRNELPGQYYNTVHAVGCGKSGVSIINGPTRCPEVNLVELFVRSDPAPLLSSK